VQGHTISLKNSGFKVPYVQTDPYYNVQLTYKQHQWFTTGDFKATRSRESYVDKLAVGLGYGDMAKLCQAKMVLDSAIVGFKSQIKAFRTSGITLW
jgi:hypothetical protein